MMLLAISVLVALTIAVAATFLFSQNNDVARRVAVLDPATSRTAASGIVQRVFSDRDRSKLRQKFIEAGWYRTSATKFYTLAVISGAVTFALLFGIVWHFGWAGQWLFLFGTFVGGFVGLSIPNYVLDGAIRERKIKVQETLPDWLDMVSTTVEAGIALNGALAMSVEALQGPLQIELREVLADVKLGRSRAEALGAMAERVNQIDLTSTVLAMVQTEKLGGNIGKMLDELAADSRNRRLMRAEEIAAQMPVKMAIPMALFMLPALVVIIFVPVAADLYNRFSK